MIEADQPKYPIYIPSKGRAGISDTAKLLISENIHFSFVVEPQEYENYRSNYPQVNILTIGIDNPGSVVTSRNFCKEHSIKNHFDFHWQIDDNIKFFGIVKDHKVIKSPTRVILSEVEQFNDKYKNIGISGISHCNFALKKKYAIEINKQVFSCVLVNNDSKAKYREGVVEDTDYSLQILALGLCTVKFNYCVMQKAATMTTKGGNTDTIYRNDGRIKQARGLQKNWPGLFTVIRKGNNPRVVGNHIWKKFKTKLIKK